MQDLIDPRDSVSDTTDEVYYDIDTDIDIIQAHVSNQQRAPGSRMPFPRWKSLSPDTQAIWDTIPDSDKALILGLGDKNPPMRRVRFHDLARPGFVEDVASDPMDTTLVDADSLVSSSTSPPDPGSTVLAHASTTTKRTWTKPKGSDLPPSDIRKV